MTVSEAISEVTQQVNAIQPNQAYAYMKKVHRYICDNYLLQSQDFTLNVTAGQRTYALSLMASNVKRVRTVSYIPSAGSFIPLLPENTRDWDRDYSGWREMNLNTPVAFSVEEGNITLRWTPSTSSVGSGSSAYPRLNITCAVAPSFTQTDNLPPDVFEDVYIVGTIIRWAEVNAPQLVPLYMPQFMQQLESMKLMLFKSSQNYTPQWTPTAMYARPN